MSEDFVCADCGGTFSKGWSDAEALEEAMSLFNSKQLASGLATLCDECFANALRRVKA